MRTLLFLPLLTIALCAKLCAQPGANCNLSFDSLATRWDEAMPIGNGWMGALIWKKNDKIRLSLDRVDLWDDRPMPGIDKLRFAWVAEQVRKRDYDTVQQAGDLPYEKYPAPTKIPAAALEFDGKRFGRVLSNVLDISTGLSTVRFESGMVMFNYVHAVKQVGYFGFENITAGAFTPELIIPSYHLAAEGQVGNSVEGQGLQRLGYPRGTLQKSVAGLRYHQPTTGNNYYEVLVNWLYMSPTHVIGQWTISYNHPAQLPALQQSAKEPTAWKQHKAWWDDYWSRSAVSLPDPVLQKQYYLEMYKFGCVARPDAPPISLQAIWTADNGNLPPWKGDYHHDLNTQLSYWPGYASNHLDLTASYTNWLWKIQSENKRWTRQYFGADGLNVPGVTTISGKAMGGWIQYSMSATTAAWLAQHFYWQWRYSMDSSFLSQRARPYIVAVDQFVHSLARKGGWQQPLLSSSPEYHDNSIDAWFTRYTNYDLALLKQLFFIQHAVLHPGGDFNATTLVPADSLLPPFDVNQTGLTIAPGQNLDESHRHHAHLMAIYPLGLMGPDQQPVMDASLRWLETMGTRNWCGYSFSWAACLYARARQADKAAAMLSVFANNFCSVNSFHLNGDQHGGRYSSFTYRPFTLEGNFAFAQGIHEMLLQSYQGFIDIFPAVPASWKDVSFRHLRTEGAFLVDATKNNGVADSVRVTAEHSGQMRIRLPFPTWMATGIARNQITQESHGVLSMSLKKGQSVLFRNAFE